jgi:hypothetical protein
MKSEPIALLFAIAIGMAIPNTAYSQFGSSNDKADSRTSEKLNKRHERMKSECGGKDLVQCEHDRQQQKLRDIREAIANEEAEAQRAEAERLQAQREADRLAREEARRVVNSTPADADSNPTETRTCRAKPGEDYYGFNGVRRVDSHPWIFTYVPSCPGDRERALSACRAGGGSCTPWQGTALPAY